MSQKLATSGLYEPGRGAARAEAPSSNRPRSNESPSTKRQGPNERPCPKTWTLDLHWNLAGCHLDLRTQNGGGAIPRRAAAGHWLPTIFARSAALRRLLHLARQHSARRQVHADRPARRTRLVLAVAP